MLCFVWCQLVSAQLLTSTSVSPDQIALPAQNIVYHTRHTINMTDEVFWTIIFGLIATAIGLVTVWQNAQIVNSRRKSSEYFRMQYSTILTPLTIKQSRKRSVRILHGMDVRNGVHDTCLAVTVPFLLGVGDRLVNEGI